jgi:hypothetical protein
MLAFSNCEVSWFCATVLNHNSLEQLRPQDFVLNLQVLDLPSQFFLCRAGDYQPQRLNDIRHSLKMTQVLLHPESAHLGTPAASLLASAKGFSLCFEGWSEFTQLRAAVN